MITKFAFLPHNLPGHFRRLPAVASVGYLMPRTRHFFAGISFSVALHAAVLFGINPPVRQPAAVEPPDRAGGSEEAIILAQEEPVKQEPTQEDAKTEEHQETAGPSEAPAHFAEPIANPIGGDISIKVDPVGCKLPDLNAKGWDVPRNPPVNKRLNNVKVFRKEDLDMIPVATGRISPRYPSELKRAGVVGTALLRFVVDSRGEVTDIEVVSATHPEFGVAAAEAMRRWNFKAGMKDGRRVNTRMEMPMGFTLDRGA